MKIILKISALCLAICLVLALNSSASEVVQGKCLEYNTEVKIIKLEEFDTNFSKEAPYGQSTSIVSEFDFSKAKIGITPEPGDILRIAFKINGDAKKAIKIMNVSKQDLRKK